MTPEEIADLLGVSEARISQLRATAALPDDLEELEATRHMERRLRLARALVEEHEVAIAVTAGRRILAISRGAARVFWRTQKALLATPLAELVRESWEQSDRESWDRYRVQWKRTFDPYDPSSSHAQEGEPEVEPRPLRIQVLPRVWRAPTPEDGLGYVTWAHVPSPSYVPSAADQELVDKVEALRPRRAEHPDQPWRFYPVEGSYPVLGSDAVACDVSYRDVDSSASEATQGQPGSRAAIRIYRFVLPSIREGITREILELEYSVRSLAKDERDFGKALRDRITDFFERKVAEIGRRFMAEYVTLFNFRIGRESDSAAYNMGSPRVLLPLGTYGMPAELSKQEAFVLRDGEGGHIGEFFHEPSARPDKPIDFTKPDQQNKALQPNVTNLNRNSRFGAAHNALLVKVRLPPRNPTDQTQVYGCLRLVNMFEPSNDPLGFKPLQFGGELSADWRMELIEVTEHLAIMYQQWLRISRRWIIARAIHDLNRDSTLGIYVRQIMSNLRTVSEFEHVVVWQEKQGNLICLEEPDIHIPVRGTYAGDAYDLGEPIDTEFPPVGQASLNAEQDALQRRAEMNWQRALEGEGRAPSKPPSRKILLKNAFEIPLVSGPRKWGVMTFYNTWSSREDAVTLYRDETLEFCRSLAGLIAAKHER